MTLAYSPARPADPVGSGGRCRCDAVAARGADTCQLTAGHAGAHAAISLDACRTWDDTSTQGWRLLPAPAWLVALPWAPGWQPDSHRTGDDGLRPVDERNLPR